jgi:hypothetical protein
LLCVACHHVTKYGVNISLRGCSRLYYEMADFDGRRLPCKAMLAPFRWKFQLRRDLLEVTCDHSNAKISHDRHQPFLSMQQCLGKYSEQRFCRARQVCGMHPMPCMQAASSNRFNCKLVLSTCGACDRARFLFRLLLCLVPLEKMGCRG